MCLSYHCVFDPSLVIPVEYAYILFTFCPMSFIFSIPIILLELTSFLPSESFEEAKGSGGEGRGFIPKPKCSPSRFKTPLSTSLSQILICSLRHLNSLWVSWIKQQRNKKPKVRCVQTVAKLKADFGPIGKRLSKFLKCFLHFLWMMHGWCWPERWRRTVWLRKRVNERERMQCRAEEQISIDQVG